MRKYNKRVEEYAYKFVHDTKEGEYPTVEKMQEVFKNCIRLPLNNMYMDISLKVMEIRSGNLKI